MATKTVRCPICGNAPIIDKEPLWRTYGGSTHGYYNQYEYSIRCSEDECPMSKVVHKSDDIGDRAEAAKERIKARWNEKCVSVKNLMEHKEN